MNTTVIVYGGAFNPPTRAHQAILQSAINYVAPIHGEVWLLPSGENNKKKTGLDRSVRLRYLEALIASVQSNGAKVRIELLELDADYRTDKVETVETLQAMYPEISFLWLYGSDSMETIDAWGGEWLKQHTDILVAVRDENFDTSNLPARTKILSTDTVGLPSSSFVRDQIKDHKDYKPFVPDLVYSEINPDEYRS